MGSRKTAFVIGLGDGTATRLLHKRQLGFERFITVRLPGETMVAIPGQVFDSEVFSAGDLVRDAFSDHRDLIALADAEFFDSHPISVPEPLRETFALDFYRILADKPLDFGDDILDGIQGAYHMAQNAELILRGPMPQDFPRMTCPAIAVASGPSLQRHLPAIRALQGKALIFASDSALDGLLAAGIQPHFVTPVERIPEIARAFSHDRYPGVVFAGKAVVHSDIVRKFDRHLFAPCTDVLWRWAGAEKADLTFYGQSTGVMAMALACQMTSGPVYLAGHDLAMDGSKSHWAGARAILVESKDTFETKGYSGAVFTDWWWDMFRRQIEAKAREHGNVVNLNALDGVGAVIDHTLSGSLPQPADLPDLIFPDFPEPNASRIVSFKAKLRRLPKDIARMLARLATRNPQVEDLSVERLTGGSPNDDMLAYCLRSVFAQFSYETYADKPTAVVAKGMATALRNVLSECRGIFDSMAAYGSDA